MPMAMAICLTYESFFDIQMSVILERYGMIFMFMVIAALTILLFRIEIHLKQFQWLHPVDSQQFWTSIPFSDRHL